LIPYYLLIIFTLTTLPFENNNKKIYNFIFFLYIIFLILFIGLRHETGGDWVVYSDNYHFYGENFAFDPNIRSDIAFELLSYIFYQIFKNIYFFNLFISMFMIFSLYRFAANTKSPSSVFFISLPLIVLILFMGFVRQGLAFAFLLHAILSLKRNKLDFFYLYIILGTLFHKSLLIFLFVGFFLEKRFIMKLIIIFLASSLIFYARQDLVHLYSIYLGKYKGLFYDKSEGTLQRILLNIVPALLYLFIGKKITDNNLEYRFYLFISLLVILFFFIKDISLTFFDRVNYYFMPLQLLVYANINKLNLMSNIKTSFKLIVIIGYVFILFYWLLFANHSIGWLPYKNILLL